MLDPLAAATLPQLIPFLQEFGWAIWVTLASLSMLQQSQLRLVLFQAWVSALDDNGAICTASLVIPVSLMQMEINLSHLANLQGVYNGRGVRELVSCRCVDSVSVATLLSQTWAFKCMCLLQNQQGPMHLNLRCTKTVQNWPHVRTMDALHYMQSQAVQMASAPITEQ